MIHSVRKVYMDPSRSGARHSRLITAFMLACGLAAALPAQMAYAQDGAGLKGILPTALPERVDAVFNGLTDNWQQWSEETAGLLAKLYSEDPGDIAAQKETLDQLDKRLATVEKSLAAPEYASIYDSLVAVHGVLSRRVELFRAILDTSASDTAALRGHLTTLVKSIEDYEANSSTAAAKSFREAYKAIRSTAADGGELITTALRNSHLNYNARIATTEAFVHRVLAEERVEEGEVRDFILCADVFGSQVTCTSSGIDFLPQDNGIRFNVTLSGVVNSSTDGYTSKAVVHTEGTHTFWATKEVSFDGTKFVTQPAGINVNADNTPTKARTKISGIPFLGSIADDTAIQRARQLEPESEAIAAERVSSRVTPRFNEEVDNKFAKATTDYQTRLVGPLSELNQFPDTIHYQTTDTHLISASRLMTAGELGAGTPHPSLTSLKGMTILVHESMFNNSIDRMELQGKTMTAAELRKYIEDRFSKIFEKKDKTEAPASDEADPNGLKSMVFAGEDPLRVQFSNGTISVILRTGFKREGQEDVAPHIVRIPLKPVINGDQVTFTRDEVFVGAIGDSNLNIRRGIQSKVEKEFKVPDPITRTQVIDKGDDKKTQMTLTAVRAVDGWLALTFE